MGINSLPRRVAKRVLYRTLGEGGYARVQAIVKERDIRRGIYSEPEVDLIPAAVEPGEVAIDVGANFGLYTCHLARAVGPTGHVHAFEPVPFTHRVLCGVVRRAGLRNVTIHHRGCGERAETQRFVIPLQESGAIKAGLAHRERTGEETEGETRRLTCEIVRLDDALGPEAMPTFIKLDTEGTELLALRGAQEMIARSHPTIQVEVGRSFLQMYGLDLDDVSVFFAGHGYELFRFKQGRLVHEPELKGGNCIYVHPARKDRFGVFLDA